jgi:phosphoenolpyruvate carboxylase
MTNPPCEVDLIPAAAQQGNMASLPAIANNSDIRFLGKLLGDVIRAYGGERLFEATETIRKASVERHRDASEGKAGDDRAVDLSLEKLSLDETLDFVRGFMLFSMLANLAEDRQGIAAEDGADLASAIAQLESEGIDRTQIRKLLDHALIAPVLTAHPTEVRRKSAARSRPRHHARRR